MIGGGSVYGSRLSVMCEKTGLCAVNGNKTGCFRINDVDGSYAFCGQGFFSPFGNLSLQMLNWARNQANSGIQLALNRTQCTSGNVDKLGTSCYCNDRDFCNDISGANHLIYSCFVILFMLFVLSS